ncbi:hypothetical protein B0H10DRAFT_1949331 [Mycena sp. CBHHK59/15]|nr:hypothetical protein B0H10DRAFT_1949331 [Mycena sp. CBHHK59/15]
MAWLAWLLASGFWLEAWASTSLPVGTVRDRRVAIREQGTRTRRRRAHRCRDETCIAWFFLSVLCSDWGADEDEANQFRNEKALVLSSQHSRTSGKRSASSSTAHGKCIDTNFFLALREPSRQSKEKIMPRPGHALGQAAQNILAAAGTLKRFGAWVNGRLNDGWTAVDADSEATPRQTEKDMLCWSFQIVRNTPAELHPGQIRFYSTSSSSIIPRSFLNQAAWHGI